MRKLLRPKDILFISLAGIGDLMEQARDPLRLVSSAYDSMYGFVPRRYKRNNFLQIVNRGLKTGDIEKVIKNNKVYLRLTASGKSKIKRDFPITNLTRKWNKHWTIIIFDIEERSRIVRDSLRKKLRHIGFGMLQESVWITPLPIGEDVWEFIESIGLNNNVFVMEVLAMRLGSPEELARKVWNLDLLEEKYIKIKAEIDSINQLIKKYNDRDNKREAKTKLKGKVSPYVYMLKSKKRMQMRRLLDFVISLPPLPLELLPKSFREEKLGGILFP